MDGFESREAITWRTAASSGAACGFTDAGDNHSARAVKTMAISSRADGGVPAGHDTVRARGRRLKAASSLALTIVWLSGRWALVRDARPMKPAVRGGGVVVARRGSRASHADHRRE